MQQHHIDVGLLEIEARGNVLERVAQAEHVETVGGLGVRSISVVRVEEEADLFGCVSAARCRPKSARGRCRGDLRSTRKMASPSTVRRGTRTVRRAEPRCEDKAAHDEPADQ